MTHTLFDPEGGIAARDEALARVGANAPIDWKTAAMRAVRDLALAEDEFTTDDVWAHLHDQGVTGPHEPRALGAVMREAAGLKIITITDRVKASDRPVCHRNPKRVWRSLLRVSG